MTDKTRLSRGRAPTDPDPRCERGIALVVALMAMLVMAALGTALILAAAVESKITRNFRNNAQALYAADAVLERSVDELRAIADWNMLLSGSVRSAFADGEPQGVRTLADGRTIDLSGILNDANCRKTSACSNAAMDAITMERPWGPNNPRWQPFAWGPLDRLTSTATVAVPFYVMVMVADDASECDDNPLVDGGAMVSCPAATKANPGAGVLILRAEAFGPFGAHRVIELTVAQMAAVDGNEEPAPVEAGPGADPTVSYNSGNGQTGVRILSWREVR
jgi:type IV pilus assembly PilX-like protein